MEHVYLSALFGEAYFASSHDVAFIPVANRVMGLALVVGLWSWTSCVRWRCEGKFLSETGRPQVLLDLMALKYAGLVLCRFGYAELIYPRTS